MLRNAHFLLLGLLWNFVAGEELLDEEDTCRIGEPCQRASLLQVRTNERQSVVARPITVNELRASENKFTGKVDSFVGPKHGDIGGDRMTHNGYGPIYEKYLPIVVGKMDNPTIAEVGIFMCTGVAMWADLFPKSKIFGFDINTTTCTDNFGNLFQRGFHNEHVTVTQMDQTADDHELLKSVLGGNRLDIVVDDGLHVPEVNVETFVQLKPHLAERFVYFIEDVYPEHIEDQQHWKKIEAQLKAACPNCGRYVERPENYEGHEKTSRVIVLTSEPL